MFVFERRLKDVFAPGVGPCPLLGGTVCVCRRADRLVGPGTYAAGVLTYQNIAKRYPPPFRWLETRTLQRAHGLISGGRTVAEVQRVRVARQKAQARSTDAFAEDIITLGVDTAVFTGCTGATPHAQSARTGRGRRSGCRLYGSTRRGKGHPCADVCDDQSRRDRGVRINC